MKGLYALLLGIMLAATAHAATVTIRSGEHDDFTRLVLNFDAGSGWTLGRVSDGWEFRTTDRTLTFDTRQVFDRIPRKRLQRLMTPGNGVLRLVAQCDCHLRSFWFTGNHIVIDVVDGAPSAENPFETALAPLEDRKHSETTLPEPASALSMAIDEVARNGPRRLDPGAFDSALRANDQARRSAHEFETTLREQLARAAGQDLVASVPDAQRAVKHLPVESDEALRGEPATNAPPNLVETAAARHAGVRIETVIDRDSPQVAHAHGLIAQADVLCPEPSLYDLPEWGLLSNGAADIATFRKDLAGASDELDAAQALALARYYIFLGFGAEARQTLSLVQATDTAVGRALVAMSEIVDAEGLPPPDANLDGFEGCDGPVALWSMLADRRPTGGQEVNEAAVIRGFGDLPPHIRALLGPPLAARLINARLVETASIIRNAMNLSGPPGSPEIAVANAEVDLATGNRDRAEARLDTTLAEHRPDAAQPLLMLAELQLADGEIPDPTHLGALGAIADEQPNTALARRIAFAEAETLIRQGDFLAARETIDTRLTMPDDPVVGALFRNLYTEAASRATSAVFLRLVLPAPARLGTETRDMAAREAIATRLNQLGFPDAAEAVTAFARPAGSPGRGDQAQIPAAGEALPGRIDPTDVFAGTNSTTPHESLSLPALTGFPPAVNDQAVLPDARETAEHEDVSTAPPESYGPGSRAIATRSNEPGELPHSEASPRSGPLERAKDLVSASRADLAEFSALLDDVDRAGNAPSGAIRP